MEEMELAAVEIESGVARLTMQRAEARNALNPVLARELVEALCALAADDAVRVIVLAGAGPVFCAGGDLGRMAVASQLTADENEQDVRELAAVFRTIYECPKPVIARVHGAAYGGGAGLVAACDLAAGVAGAKFCFSEVRLGLLPAIISPYVVRRMAPAAVRRYFLTGEVFTASTALQHGLLAEIVADEAALDTQIGEWCEALKKGAPGALALAKRLPDRAAAPLTEHLMSEMSQLLCERRGSAEGIDGAAAYFEKRTPKWSA